MVGGNSLNGGGNDGACAFLAFGAGFVFDLHDQPRQIVPGLILDFLHQDRPRFFGAQGGNPGQLSALLFFEVPGVLHMLLGGPLLQG